jgi:DNA-binding response OmpR family regulator
MKKAKTVLLVDDESPWLEVISMALEDEAFKVITADSGEAALKKLKSRKPDLILSDVRMPNMNGFDLYEKVRSNPKLKKIPYVFMSSLDDYDAKRVAQELGADDYVAKPFDTNEVKTIVLDLLSRFKEKQ